MNLNKPLVLTLSQTLCDVYIYMKTEHIVLIVVVVVVLFVLWNNKCNEKYTDTWTNYSCNGLTGKKVNAGASILGDGMSENLVSSANIFAIDKTSGSTTQGTATALQGCATDAGNTLTFCEDEGTAYACGNMTFATTSVPELMGVAMQNSAGGNMALAY